MKKFYDEAQVREAQNKLAILLPEDDVCNGQLFQKFYNTRISQDFTRKDLKRISVVKCHFANCKFNAVAATGSKFTKVQFDNCDLSGANFQYCYFNNTHFINDTIMKGANFSHSIFIDCTFETITIIESTLYDCYFENCTFSASVIRTNTLENSVLCNCNIQNIDLSHINLEYMRFDNIRMKNVTLPPYQIPYIIGATTYLKTTSDKVQIYTDTGNIDLLQYCDLYEELATYFYANAEYFPMANIYIALNKQELAFECIRLGIKEACDYFDFRMVKHFCKLACSYRMFTHTQLKELYDLITDLSYDNKWDLNTLHSYMLNIGEIKEILLNNSLHKERVEFVIKTNIDKDNLTAINDLYNQINGIIRQNCSDTHVDAIELRHNSPYEIYVTCIDLLPNIFLCISAMYAILSAGNKFLDIYKNFEETRRVHQQNEFYKYELEEKLLDIEVKRKQLEQMNEQTSQAETKTASGIYLVREIEHNIKCNSLDTAKNIAPEYLHYKYSRSILEQ